MVYTEYIVEIKGIKENKNNWRSVACYNKLYKARGRYNLITGGCCKRLIKITKTTTRKIIQRKDY